MPRTKEINQSIIDKRIDCILDSALYLFALYGYRATSMDDIAKWSKCSRALVYHYFPTKDLVFKKLMCRIHHELDQITDLIDWEEKADDSLEKLLQRLLDSIDKNTQSAAMIRLVLNLHLQGKYLPKPPILKKDLPLNKKPLYYIVYYLIDKGQQENYFYKGNAKEYTIVILSLIEGLAYNKIYLDKKYITPNVKTLMNIVKKEDTTC